MMHRQALSTDKARPGTTTTDHQLEALKILMDDPDNHHYAVTRTNHNDLYVRIDTEREYLIDPDGTVIDMHHIDARQTI